MTVYVVTFREDYGYDGSTTEVVGVADSDVMADAIVGRHAKARTAPTTGTRSYEIRPFEVEELP